MDHGHAAPLTLLDALARAHAAAALVVAALGEADRKALRLAHSRLRDAVGEATTELRAILPVTTAAPAAARPPTPGRWPCLEALTATKPDLEALGSGTWHRLRTLTLHPGNARRVLDEPLARAAVAALRRMPALRALSLHKVAGDEAEALFDSSAADAPHLRALTISSADLTQAAARALAATGWRLEELDLTHNVRLGAAGVAALAAAPTFAIRRMNLTSCGLDAAALLARATAPWPLEELDLSFNDFSAAAAALALAALSRHRGLRVLNLRHCNLSAAGVKALVEAAWPALRKLSAHSAPAAVDGPLALGAAAFAGFPALEELAVPTMVLDDSGAALLSRRWPLLMRLNLCGALFGAGGAAALAALAHGEWPALKTLRVNAGLGPLTLEAARRWAPALEALEATAATLPGL